MMASVIAMCLSINAFAEDDGYGNDIPAARQEGTVDDGYGNKLPEYGQQPEYKSFEEARASRSSGGSSTAPLRFAGHFAIGLGSYWDYPNDYLGDNDWIGVTMDLGGLINYRINSLLSIVPELNFGFNVSMREIARGTSWWYGDYKVNETRVLFNINIPVTLRVTPMPFLYVEAGGRISLNLGTDHTLDYYDQDNEKIDVPKEFSQLEKWKVNTFVPSIVAGIGGTVDKFDIGARLILDLGGIEKEDKFTIPVYDENGNFKFDENGFPITKTAKNDTKNWTVQLLMNYYFN